MADAWNRNQPRKSSRGGPELGIVRIRYRPAPDAQDRLRRLFTLLVRYATAEGTTLPETHSPRRERRRNGGKVKRPNNEQTGKRHGFDLLTGSPLTPARRRGMIRIKGWPGGADNTPGRGATC